MRWIEMKKAPKDGTKFIATMADGLVFLTHWQAYHTYLTKEESEKLGRVGFHPARMRNGWSYEDDSSHNPCSPIGWIPIPKAEVVK